MPVGYTDGRSENAFFFHDRLQGADPDNVAQQETVGELLPLRTRELPPTKSHEGKVSELLTSPESVALSNVLLNKTQVCRAKWTVCVPAWPGG